MKFEDLKVKQGKEYWTLVEQTARRVEKWPEWKKGAPAPKSPEESRISSDGNEVGRQVAPDRPAR